MNGSGVMYGGPPPRGGWPYPGEVVLYGCPPIEPPHDPFIVPPTPPSLPTPWLEAQMAELQKALTATHRELAEARAELARLKARPTRRRDRRRGNIP